MQRSHDRKKNNIVFDDLLYFLTSFLVTTMDYFSFAQQQQQQQYCSVCSSGLDATNGKKKEAGEDSIPPSPSSPWPQQSQVPATSGSSNSSSYGSKRSNSSVYSVMDTKLLTSGATLAFKIFEFLQLECFSGYACKPCHDLIEELDFFQQNILGTYH